MLLCSIFDQKRVVGNVFPFNILLITIIIGLAAK